LTPKLRVAAFTLSLDGFGAGPDQSRERPLGRGAEALHRWLHGTATFRRRVLREEGGSTGLDDRFAAASFEGVGAWIIGRNMFGPVRGAWPDEAWRGWWGEAPPFGVPVFVLTHHPRRSFDMTGGTSFHFVTEGPAAALERARKAAGGRDVRIGGGVATVRQYLAAGLVDEMHLALVPAPLGRGEALLAGIDLVALGYAATERAASEEAMHVVLARRGGAGLS
jgi:dihydrofolate reductase